MQKVEISSDKKYFFANKVHFRYLSQKHMPKHVLKINRNFTAVCLQNKTESDLTKFMEC